MKIAHIADTHIKQIKDHKDYIETFYDLFDKLKQERPDIIVHCGDIAHNKTSLSPEFIDICAFFIRGLTSIAPTIIILGNHDGNLNNLSRQDAISPIISLLPKNLQPFLFRSSGDMKFGDIKFHIISRFDDNFSPEIDDSLINIVLYHGSISGCKTDSGFILKKGDANLSFFNAFDFGLFGDIHKHQFLDDKGRFAYAGSTCIQNFGESGDKGFLLWDIKSKDDFSCRLVPLLNANPYLTINANDIDFLSMPQKCKLRIIFDDESESKKSEILAKIPSNIHVETRSISSKQSRIIDLANEKKLNFDIFQYISQFESDEIRQNNIIEEIKKIRSELKIQETKFLSQWKIKRFSWDNFFNYGEKNSIDLDSLSGNILGIFGKNYSGKSSIIDVLLFSIFGECTKNFKKLGQIVNSKKQFASCEVEICGDGKNYLISRTIDSGKGSLLLHCDGNCLNGADKNETEKIIKHLFGSAEHFLLSSIVSQFDCFQFLNATSSKRKDFLLSFLDLDEIEKIGERASLTLRDLKAEKKIWDGKGLYAEKERISSVLLADLSSREREHESGIEAYRANLTQLEAMQKLSSSRFLVKDHACKSKQEFEERKQRCQERFDKIPGEVAILTKFIQKKESFVKKVESFDDKQVFSDHQIAIERFAMINKLKNENISLHSDIGYMTGSVSVLASIPCDKEMGRICPLTKNAYENKDKIDGKLAIIKENSTKIKELEAFHDNDNESIAAMQEFQKILEKRVVAKSEIEKSKLDLRNLDFEMKKNEEFYALLSEYGEESFYSSVNQFQLASIKSDILAYEKNEMALGLAKANIEEKIASVDADIEKLKVCNEMFQMFSTLGNMFHRDGLTSIVIDEFIPCINKKMDEILQNLVDFSIRIENCKDKLEIYLKSANGERSIELCSGSEKTFAAMALRIALTKLGNIPSSNVFILDEPATSLDDNHILQFQKFLNMAKEEFDSVILITHLESMKDSADCCMNVVVDEDGYAGLQ